MERSYRMNNEVKQVVSAVVQQLLTESCPDTKLFSLNFSALLSATSDKEDLMSITLYRMIQNYCRGFRGLYIYMPYIIYIHLLTSLTCKI
jgi:hypothetical protein